jgi:uncharacterized protein YidB (DUF937 family)
MSLFDSITNETREKFNLGDKVNVLLSVLRTMINDKTRGGFAGFIERFNRAGLSGVASSWVNSGANTHISNEQLESALGNETLQDIADRVETDYQTTTSATAFMLPHIVDNLTPDGVLPSESDLLSRTGEYMTGATETIGGVSAANTVDRIGTVATNIIDRDRVNVGNSIGIADEPKTIGNRAKTTVENIDSYDDNDNSPLKWLLPLMLLGLLVVLGFWFCGKGEEHKSANISINVNTTKII